MYLVHPIDLQLTELLKADEDFQPEVAYWHHAQEEMERRGFSSPSFNRICAQLRIVDKKKDNYLDVLVSAPVIEPAILEQVKAADSAIVAVGPHSLFQEISPGVKRFIENQGLVEDFSSTALSSLEDEITKPPTLEHIQKNKSSKKMFEGRPAYLGGLPALPRGGISREELNAILDGPETSILDEINAENEHQVRSDSPPISAKSSVKEVDDETSQKKKKQKFVNNGKLYGSGGRNNRKRGRNGPPNCH